MSDDNPTAQTPPQYLTREDVAKRLRVAASTISRWVREGHFPAPVRLADRCYRWEAATVDAWVADKIESEMSGGDKNQPSTDK